MTFCTICSLCGLHFPQQNNPGQRHHLPSELIKELEDSRKFSLNSLLALLAVIALSGSKVLQPVVLALLIYTISLRLVVNTCFLESYPTLSRFLHAVPLLSTSCMAGIELFLDVRPPALAAIALLLSVLPLIATVIYHGRRRADLATVVLPVSIRDPRAAMSSSADVTAETN